MSKALSALSDIFVWSPGGAFDHFYKLLFPVNLVLGTIAIGVVVAYILVYFSATFAFLAVFAIPFGILMVTRPYIGLLLIVFFIPMETFNDTGGLKVLSVVVFGATFVHFWVFRRRDSLVGASQNWLIILLILAMIFSIFFAINVGRTTEGVGRIIRVLSLYIVLINVVRSEKSLKLLLWIFILSGVISAISGITDPEQQGERMTGMMENANAFAAEMVVRFPIALALFIGEKNPVRKFLMLMMLGVLVYSIGLTGSRGGLIGTGIALLLFPLAKENKLVWYGMVILIAGLGLVAMPQKMKARTGLAEQTTSEDLGNNTDRRETYQRYGLELWMDNPVTGIGLDGFAEAYGRSQYRFLQKNRTKRVAHNTYVEILAGTGIIGMIPFLLLLATSLGMGFKYSKYRDDYPYLAEVATGLFSAQGGLFLMILFGSRQYSKTFWVLMGLVVVVQNIIETSEREQRFNEDSDKISKVRVLA